jgi:DNA-binding IclR family transcriptional regulator
VAGSQRKLEESTYRVQVLDRVVDIFNCFTLSQREVSLTKIVEATGLNGSTATRITASMERHGLLQKASTKGSYRLGPRLFEMGAIVCASFSLRDAAVGPLAALERRSGATILLASRNGEYSVIVERRQGVGEGRAMVSLPDEVGTVRPVTHGLIGHVILATLAPETVNDLLDKYPLEQSTPYSVIDREVFLERLPLVRSRGYAIEVNEVLEGLMSVAAPILDFAGKIVGVLALGLPSTRECDEAFLNVALEDLKQAASEVSSNMGYAPPEPAEESDEAITDTSKQRVVDLWSGLARTH